MQIIPFLVLGTGIVISLLIEMYSSKSDAILPWLTIALLIYVAVHSINEVGSNDLLFGGMLAVGGKSSIFNFLFAVGGALVSLGAIDYIKKYGANFGEFYVLVQSSILGMMFMSGARDILVVFLGLELMSICFYVLVGINRKKINANEASMKYFLLGAFATGFIVYGVALVFGTAQTMRIGEILVNFSSLSGNILFMTGFILLIVGFAFKIAAFPFHMWVPDVYTGSSTAVTGLMSTGGKAAAFSVLLVLLGAVFTQEIENTFMPLFAGLAVLSMLYGSIVAIAQNNLKRMLAYSSISHAGYMLIGLAAGNLESVTGIMFYLVIYVFMNIGAFGIIAIIEGPNDDRVDLNSYAGLHQKNPVLALFMALFMLALAGLPPLAGFFGKYYVFIAAIESDLTWLAIVGVFSSVISVYFYLRVIVYMYFKESEVDFNVNISPTGLMTVVICGLLLIVYGLFPGSLLGLIASVVN
ncbi:MAG: NADH-quinone oxidoreductase subunit N [Melioribacteraceae bacterium]|nr:NADH-quinone oxidoreductase subunit N [Melioribacteraceae bacterium]MCF8264375.1 NADH-quinone oxidoreductase subunit N [Melioribacteraceae bacterium]